MLIAIIIVSGSACSGAATNAVAPNLNPRSQALSAASPVCADDITFGPAPRDPTVP